MNQKRFDFGTVERAENLLTDLLRLFEANCEEHQKQLVAAELGIHPSTLTNMLKGKQGISAQKFLALMLADGHDRALAAIAAVRGYELKPVMTAEEQLRRYKEELRKLAGPLADEVERRALGDR